jgi:hypothetical protein
MIVLFFLVFFISIYECKLKKCQDCKFFLINENSKITDGYCKAFGTSLSNPQYEYASHCRKNKNLCGPSGFLFEDKQEFLKIEYLRINQPYLYDYLRFLQSSKN